MPKVPGLMRRGGGWTLRVRVPDTLREAMGRREMWVALGAGTYRGAAELARLERVRIDARFAEARRSMGSAAPAVEPSKGVILDAARRFFHELEAGATPVAVMDQEEREDRLEAAVEEAGAVAAAGADSLQPVAKRVAERAGIVLQPGTPAVAELARALHAAMIEHSGRNIDRLEGAAVAEHDPLFLGIGPNQPPTVRRMTLAEAVAAYGSTPERRHATKQTHAAVAARLALWIELLGGGTEVAAVTRDQIREGREVLLRLPAYAAKRWPGVPIREVVRRAERDGVAPQSAKNAKSTVVALAALLAWCERENKIAQSPARGLSRVEEITPRTKRRPFTIGELRRLLDSPVYQQSIWDLQQWGPLIALFCGLRAGEIAGLRRDDVSTVDGVLVLHVRPHAGRRLKTDGSERDVPVHPMLLEAGFGRWMATRPAGGDLFASRAEGVIATEKRMLRPLRALFSDPALVFHSFRHNFVDALRAGGVSTEIAERLGGWRSNGSARLNYGVGFSVSQLATDIAKISYVGVNVPQMPG